jgi:hypothetical protein
VIAEPPSVPGVKATVSEPLAGVTDEIVGGVGEASTS